MSLSYDDMIDEAAERSLNSPNDLDSDINVGFRQAISQMFDVPRTKVYQDVANKVREKVEADSSEPPAYSTPE